MTHPEYEQKRRECWEEFLRKHEISRADGVTADAFIVAFDRACALGKQEIKQEIKQEKDAEGEEMLTVSRKKVQRRYHMAYKCKHSGLLSHDDVQFWKGWQGALDDLFGSKCLPDELPEDNFAKSEPNPAEPKFKVGDYVRYKGGVHKVVATAKDNRCYLNKILGCIDESDLEPYTEQEASTCTDDCSSQCTSPDHIADASKKADDDLCYKLIQRGFRNHNRLNIATRIATAILGNPDEAYRAKTCGKGEQIPQNIAEYAVAIADALIAEAEKGGIK